MSEEGIVSTEQQIKTLEDGIRAPDKIVAEATEQQRQENEDYTAGGGCCRQGVVWFREEPLEQSLQPQALRATCVGQRQGSWW